MRRHNAQVLDHAAPVPVRHALHGAAELIAVADKPGCARQKTAFFADLMHEPQATVAATEIREDDTVDLVLLGYYFGKGKRTEFGLGALLAGVYDSEHDRFETITKIGTGLSDAGWREIHQRADPLQVKEKPARVRSLLTPDVWLKPEVVVEVLADEITPGTNHTAGKIGDGPGYALRFPRIVSFRGADKRPEDATTVKEIIEMYRQQGRKAVPG